MWQEPCRELALFGTPKPGGRGQGRRARAHASSLLCLHAIEMRSRPAGSIAGKWLALTASTGKKRVSTLPDVPTSAEAGLPKLKPIVDALVDALQRALKDPPLVSRFAELSMAPVEHRRATPAALEALLKGEIERWGLIIKQAGIEPQ